MQLNAWFHMGALRLIPALGIALILILGSLTATTSANAVSPTLGKPVAGMVPVDSPNIARSVLEQAQTGTGVHFEKNLGQWNTEALYKVHGTEYTGYLTADRLVMVFTDRQGAAAIDSPRTAGHVSPAVSINNTAVSMTIVGSNPSPLVTGDDLLGQRSNYFIGNDATKWAINVPHYRAVTFHGIYPGIDLVYFGTQDGLKYNFIVHPGASPSTIQLDYQGMQSLAVESDGSLAVTTAQGVFHHAAPYTYQTIAGITQTIPTHYMSHGSTVAFQVAPYDATKDLIVDPLVYSTYLGGSGYDFIGKLALDASGKVYVSGWTDAVNYPTTMGVYQTSSAGSYDVVVTKLNAAGTGVVFSTYLGGSDTDYGQGISIDASGNVYVTGQTWSTNFPTTAGAYQTTKAGTSSNAFVTKLNAAGSSLAYSTYVGGTNGDSGTDIAVDGSGNSYITGWTHGNFPTTGGAFQTNFGGGQDPFVAKLNPTGTALAYSTYLGGNSDDFGHAIAVDTLGRAYVTGSSRASNFPTTAGAYQTVYGGGWAWGDVFVSMLNSAGSALSYSTYIGGSSDESGYDIAIDGAGNAYVTGYSESTNYPTTSGAYDTSLGGGRDVIATKLNPTGTTLAYSSFLGGSDGEYGQGIAIDASGNIFITGSTASANFPKTAGAVQTTCSGGYECAAFVSKLNGASLLYSTYLGGYGNDDARSIAVDASGHIYIAGYTEATDYPTTSGSFQPSFGGGFADGFVSKLDVTSTAPSAPQNLAATGGNGQITLTWQAPSSNGGITVTNYRVYRGTSSGSLFLVTTGGCSNLGNVLSCTDSGRTNGVTYYYKVAATNAVDTGPQSNEASATPATVPGAPTLNSATAGNGQVTLGWSAPASNGGSAITSYKVYRGTTSGGETLITSGGCGNLGNVLSCTDSGLADSTTYYYYVAAANSVGIGSQSNELSATTPAPLVPNPCPTPIGTPSPGQVAVVCDQPVEDPCPQGADLETVALCSAGPVCPSGTMGSPGPGEAAVVCGQPVPMPCPEGTDPPHAAACGVTACPNGLTSPPGPNQVTVVCGQPVDAPCPEGLDADHAGVCGAGPVCPSGLTSPPGSNQLATVCGVGIPALVGILPQCMDGVDNDGDGQTDYRPIAVGGGDAGCTNALDNAEIS